MKCPVCGKRRQMKSLSVLAIPVTFVVNYQTMEAREFPAGTIVCPSEWRKLNGGSLSQGQRISYRNCQWRREDGSPVFVAFEASARR